MESGLHHEPHGGGADQARSVLPGPLRLAFTVWNTLIFLAWLVGPFAAAGTAGWLPGWAYLGVLAVGLIAHQAYVAKRNPELRRERKQLGANTRRWDLVWNVFFWPLMAGPAVVAGLQARRAGATLPLPLWGVGVLLFAGGMAMSAWAMAVNRYFEGTVRIQSDRGHRVVDTGPYRFVRHPGYVGLILWACATPFLLLSTWALAAAAPTTLWIALRTALEDATLRRELDGYADYARRVRWHLIPGLW